MDEGEDMIVKLLIDENKDSRSCWSKKRVLVPTSQSKSSKSILTSTKLLILVLLGLALKFFWSAGYVEYLLYKRVKIDYTPRLFFFQPSNSVNLNDPCSCDGENFCFKGLNENGTTINGRKFNCSLYEDLKSKNLLDSDVLEIKGDFEKLDDSWQPVFVSSIASNHFNEGRKMIKSIADHYPNSKILIFDIGLKEADVNELKTWCNVEYKKFEFEKYPSHVKILKTYAFKLTIIEAIQQYKTFFYFDTSVRITGKHLLDFLHGVQNKELLPFSTHTFASHSVFSTTHREMSEFLPLPIIVTQVAEIQSTFQFVSDSPYTRYILKWWFLCAMTKDCISPNGSIVQCKLHDYHDHKRTYMNCHRFDQAYWNLAALAYLFGDKRGALELGYVDEDWSMLSENLVVQIENARSSAMGRFFKLVSIKRGDELKQTLELKCKK